MISRFLFTVFLLLNSAYGYIFPTIPMTSSFSNCIKNRQNANHLNINMQMDRRNLIKSVLVGIPTLTQFVNNANAFYEDESVRIKLFEDLAPSVCYISTEYKNVAEQLSVDTKGIPKGVGTGFVWDTEGHIVTNFHVINKVDNAIVSLVNKDGVVKEYTAKLTGIDPDKDIAVLKLDVSPSDGYTLKPIELSKEVDVKIGQSSYAIGNPFGQDHSFTSGIISGKNREMTAPTGRKIKQIIQTDTAVNPGNSGGPLVDSSGKLIGVNTATLGMGVSSGVSFALSVDIVKETVNNIIEFGVVQRAVLGISYLERNPSRKEAEKSGVPFIENGVIVLDVPNTSPAFAAGLRGIKKKNPFDNNSTNVTSSSYGDIIIGIDDYIIKKPGDLMFVLDKYKPGDKIKMTVLRENQTISLDIVLGTFEMGSFSGIEPEKKVKQTGNNTIPLDIPLKNMAPQLRP